MEVENRSVNGLVGGLALGLMLMSVFSLWWASDTFAGWPATPAIAVVLACGTGAVIFTVQAIRLLRTRPDPPLALAGTQAAKKPNSTLFGAVFAAEGLLIGVTVAILGANSLERFNVPAIAVIVGLHFYPMAFVFRRRLDIWLATWTTLLGIAGIIATVLDGSSWPLTWSWVGAGVSLATLSYGVYMTWYSQQLLRTAAEGPSRT